MNQNLEINNTVQNRDFQSIDEINKFNWGALYFGWIWGIFNGAFIKTLIPWVIILVASLIPVVNFFVPFAAIGVMVYFGLKGNEWAWAGKGWKNPVHFNDVQKKWACAAGIMLVLNIILTVVCLFAFINSMKALNSYVPEDYQTESYITTINRNSDLQYAKDSKTLTNNLMNSLKPLNSKVQKYEIYNSNTIAVKTANKQTGQYQITELYTFNKDGSICNLEKKNCSVVKYQIEGNKITPERKTYYDGDGKTAVVIVKK